MSPNYFPIHYFAVSYSFTLDIFFFMYIVILQYLDVKKCVLKVPEICSYFKKSFKNCRSFMCIMTKTFGFCVKIKEIAKFFTNILRFSYLRIFKIFKLIRKYLFSCGKLHDLHVYFSVYISCTFICFNNLELIIFL